MNIKDYVYSRDMDVKKSFESVVPYVGSLMVEVTGSKKFIPVDQRDKTLEKNKEKVWKIMKEKALEGRFSMRKTLLDHEDIKHIFYRPDYQTRLDFNKEVRVKIADLRQRFKDELENLCIDSRLGLYKSEELPSLYRKLEERYVKEAKELVSYLTEKRKQVLEATDGRKRKVHKAKGKSPGEAQESCAP